jgi:hypothetical protein
VKKTKETKNEAKEGRKEAKDGRCRRKAKDGSEGSNHEQQRQHLGAAEACVKEQVVTDGDGNHGEKPEHDHLIIIILQ